MDEDYYILTLAAIARELSRENLTEASVYLAVGLPLSWAKKQGAAFCSLWCYVGYLSSALAIASWKSLASVKISCL